MEISSIDSEDRNIREITVGEEAAPTGKYPTLSAEEAEENIQQMMNG